MGQSSYSKTACAQVAKAWLTYDFHLEDPISVMTNQWANDTCLPDPNTPCSPTGYPAYVIDAADVRNIKAGLDFGKSTVGIIPHLVTLTKKIKKPETIKYASM